MFLRIEGLEVDGVYVYADVRKVEAGYQYIGTVAADKLCPMQQLQPIGAHFNFFGRGVTENLARSKAMEHIRFLKRGYQNFLQGLQNGDSRNEQSNRENGMSNVGLQGNLRSTADA